MPAQGERIATNEADIRAITAGIQGSEDRICQEVRGGFATVNGTLGTLTGRITEIEKTQSGACATVSWHKRLLFILLAAMVSAAGLLLKDYLRNRRPEHRNETAAIAPPPGFTVTD